MPATRSSSSSRRRSPPERRKVCVSLSVSRYSRRFVSYSTPAVLTTRWKGKSMNRYLALRAAAVALASLLPICAHSAQAGSSQTAHEPATMSDEDLAKVGERIRQTGAQLRADLREARARLEAQKARDEAERKHQAGLAREQAIHERQQKEAQEAAQAKAR